MDSKRLIVYTGVFFTGMLLLQAWQQDHASVPKRPNTTAPLARHHSIPKSGEQNKEESPKTSQTKAHHFVTVSTDLQEVKIDTEGGNIAEVRLKHYTESLKDKRYHAVLRTGGNIRTSESGLEGARGPDNAEKGQAIYKAEQHHYQLINGKNHLLVKLFWQSGDGISVMKQFRFSRGDYTILESYTITNKSRQLWSGRAYSQLLVQDQKSGSMMGLRTYTGPAMSSPDQKYQKLPFKDLRHNDLDMNVTGGWIAEQDHYFIAALVPKASERFHYYSLVNDDDTVTLGMVGEKCQVLPGETKTIAPYKLYAGPEVAKNLEALAPGTLKLTIDYGSLWLICAPLFWLLEKLYQCLGNWGWAIIAITVLIKIAFYRLSEKSYRSMARMKELQPKIEAIKQRYGDDREQLGKATIELYKKEKINPVGGCLPMLIQIPIFLGLYWVLIESVELRQAPFIFWIHDLAVKDPYYILPVLMGISMFVQQKLNPKPADPIQEKVMLFLPVMLTFLFISFPAGLVLYWFVNNVLSALQQWIIMKRVATR